MSTTNRELTEKEVDREVAMMGRAYLYIQQARIVKVTEKFTSFPYPLSVRLVYASYLCETGKFANMSESDILIDFGNAMLKTKHTNDIFDDVHRLMKYLRYEYHQEESREINQQKGKIK